MPLDERKLAGVLVAGMALGATGCVERLITGQPAGTEGGSGSTTDASTSSSTTLAGQSSSGTPIFDTEDEPMCTRPDDCPDGATCFEGVCVGDGELRISLSWRYVSDLDLHVRTPEGVHISYENPNAGGGLLDVDDCIGGSCVDNAGTHVENIFFATQPPLGEYEVWVNNFDGMRGGPFDIEVSGAATAAFAGNLPDSPVESQRFRFEI